MLVQSIGESCGSSVVRLPLTPRSTIRAMPGMAPESTSGWMIFQSAESQPTRRSFFRVAIELDSYRGRSSDCLGGPLTSLPGSADRSRAKSERGDAR